MRKRTFSGVDWAKIPGFCAYRSEVMTTDDLVLLEKDGPLAVVTINRPDKLNALNAEVIRQIKRQLQIAGDDPELRAIILTGAGEKAFVAGADIGEMSELSAAQAREFSRAGQEIAEVMDRCGKPIIAAIAGFALGGGCELAMMCHLRVAGPKARFGQPEVSLGLIPGFGGTQRLARLVGESRAMEMILGGGMIDAQTALSWGLVNRVAKEGTALEAARELAGTIIRQSPAAVRLCLEAIRRGFDMPLGHALRYEASLFGVVFATEDMREGTQAFVEKRKPKFSGR